MELKPLFDRLLIKPVSSVQDFGGIIIPDTSTNLKKGICIAAGPGRAGAPMTVAVGETVFYKKDDAMAITVEGDELLVLFERDILLHA